ncbi:Intracellular protein transport protein [Actinidia chinensis var. chinensis]|uniref:Intracellular protein transport protein n=1 Tax=Actinidia chinensis var. chinensis TaxID=1590841 RepID=A0A2R6RQV6_ACTCC|nr:Intracellular protein transport protein [Actinidia chinensis var. chinensis]
MFKSVRRRSEKNKLKAVFKLQFRATQVPKVTATTLTISLVPADVGKPTVRLERAAILDGTCFWENPVYETVKLIRNQKTGRFNDKCYHFIVSTGSSKAGILGEVSINFADYVEAAKPSTVSLPLRTSNHGGSGAILHVTIHNTQGSVDQRDIEAGEAPAEKSQERSLRNQLSNHDRNGNSNLSFTENDYFNKLSSENASRTRSFKNLLAQNPIICQDDTTHRQDSMPKKRTVDTFQKCSQMHRRSNTDWSVGSASDGSMVDSPNSPEENLPRDPSPQDSDRSMENLARKISMLERQRELSELELQSLRKQIVKESKRGQDLSKQVCSLKEEKDALRKECEQLKFQMKCSHEVQVSNQLAMEAENLKVILEDIRQELNHEKDLNKDLRLQLQKTEDSNDNLIHAVNDLDEMLEQKNREIADLSTTRKANKNDKEDPKDVSDCIDEAKEVDMLKQKIAGLSSELKIYRKDEEEQKMHTEQLAMDYEILKQENHDISLKLEQQEKEQIKIQNECSEYLGSIKEFELQIERLEKKIEQQALELLDSSDRINELESQVKGLEKELDTRAQCFEDDLESVTLAKIEQEQRAIRAEEDLRKTRSNNAIAAERIQEEFTRFSTEMSSKFEENERLATKAVAEADGLRLQNGVLEEKLRKANEELGLMKEQYEVQLQELSDQKDLKSTQIEQMSQELVEKCMQIENFEKHEEEMHESFSIEFQKLKGEIEGFKVKNGFFEEAKHKENLRDESDDMEQMKLSLAEQEILQRWGKEREELKREFASARKEAQKLQEESNTLRSLKDEKETRVQILQSEVEKLKVQYKELKHCLFEVELENKNLRKEVTKLEGDLQKKEEAIIITKKKIQSNSEQSRKLDTEQTTSEENKSAPLSFGSTEDVVSDKMSFVEEARLAEKLTANARELYLQLPEIGSKDGMIKKNGVSIAPVISGVETCSKKGLDISSFAASDECYLNDLLSEVALLKERNKSMEGELKEMQERYSEISLKFAEVEGERQQLVMTVRNLKNSKKK